MINRRIIVSAGFHILLFLLCVIWPINIWFRAFIKVDEMRVPYLVSLFVLLFVGWLILQRYLHRVPMLVMVFIGAIVGHIAATISIPLASLFVPGGIEGMVKAIRMLGMMETILHHLSVSLVFGGWVFGIVSFVLMKYLESYISREKASPKGN